MTRLVLCVLALLAAGGYANPVGKSVQVLADPVLLQRQLDLLVLFSRLHEPNHVESCKAIYTTWTFEKNIEHFSNVTAVTTYIEMLEHKWVLPKAVPFNINQKEHQYEAVTLFNVLFSAKDYDTFYKSAVYVREHVNEYLFSYVLSVVILNRKDTQDFVLPPVYETFPSFFYNAEILTTAQRINTHGLHHIDYYPSTYKWNDNVVIKWNATVWPYVGQFSDAPIIYYLHDYGLNTFYYNLHIANPSWLGGEIVPLVKDRRGEWFWFIHKQILSRYYMERLSNGLGEIPVLGDVVELGYTCGLQYHNGIPFPMRPQYFHLNQPDFVEVIQLLEDYEHRIREVIDQGYIVNHIGDHINLRVPEAIDVLGRAIEANVDSPNVQFYKDFINIWKKILGNSLATSYKHEQYNSPLVVTSVLEHYQTALRDPAFYMIWKRVLGLFQYWQETLPPYKREELALPQVAIQKVEVDKLVTYFEQTYVNVSNHLYTSVEENKGVHNKVNVLVQHPRLNHKVFKVRVNVKSEVAKTVVVKFFLAPKYDSYGKEIPLHLNSENFFLFDEFLYDLPAGECVITRDSNDNVNAGKEWTHTSELYEKAQKALHGEDQFVLDQVDNFLKFPQRLVLPKGQVGGMPFILMVYISEYHAPAVPYGTGFDPTTSLGIGTGARYLTDEPLGFPVNKPLHVWQVEGLHNLVFQDVLIHHKHTPEIVVPFAV